MRKLSLSEFRTATLLISPLDVDALDGDGSKPTRAAEVLPALTFNLESELHQNVSGCQVRYRACSPLLLLKTSWPGRRWIEVHTRRRGSRLGFERVPRRMGGFL